MGANLKPVVGILAVALLLRLAAALLLGAPATHDSAFYWARALELAASGTYSDPQYPMGYPVFLAPFVAVFGTTLVPIRIAQALLGTATVWLTYDLGKRVLDERAGLVAAALLAIDPTHVVFPALLMSEVVFTVLLLVAWRGWIDRNFVWFGLALGLAAHVRPFVLYFPFFLLPLVIRDRSLLKGLAITVLLVGVVLAPRYAWTHQTLGEPVLATNDGTNLLIGNNDFADGRQGGRKIFGTEDDPMAALDKDDRLGRSEAGKAYALRWALSNPVAFAWKGVRADLALIGLPRHFAFRMKSKDWPNHPRLALWGVFGLQCLGWLVLLSLCLPGLAAKDERLDDIRLLVLFFLALHFVGFGESRFRFPLNPFLALAAARALPEWQALVKRELDPRTWVPTAALAAIVAVAMIREILAEL